MSYDRTSKGATRAAFAASAGNTRLYAAGARADTSYTIDQRIASGDRFAPADLGGTAPTSKITAGLKDAHAHAQGDASAAHVTTPRGRRQTVADFKL